MTDYYSEIRNLKLAEKMLEQQGQINKLRAERDRYAAAVERAEQYAHQLRHGDAMGLLAALAEVQHQPSDTEQAEPGSLPSPNPGLWRRVAATTARAVQAAQTANPADYDLAPPPEESGNDRRRRLARAQIVADHWRQALFNQNAAAAHALAMVSTALNGATNPSDCGLPEHLHHAYRTAGTTGGRT